MSDDPLEHLGFDEGAREQFAPFADRGLVPGRVVRVDRGQYVVVTGDGEVRAEPATRLVAVASTGVDLPAVGDWIALRSAPDMDFAIVEEVLPRHSAFVRRDPKEATDAQVLAANVDTVFVVHALADDPNVSRIERELVLAWESGASPVVVLNKADLAEDPEAARREVEAAAPGVPVLLVSALSGDGLAEVSAHVTSGRTAVFLGPSGVGKSTIVNHLVGSDVQATESVRAVDQKGRHTTVARELIELPGGGAVIDTPGLRALALWDAADGMSLAFSDIQDLAARCKFRDCRHESEPGCAVREAIESGVLDARRLESYQKLARELEHLATRKDAAARVDREKRGKQIARYVREIKKHGK